MRKTIMGLLLVVCIIAIGSPSFGQTLNTYTADTIKSISTPGYNMFAMNENAYARMKDTIRGYVIESKFPSMAFYNILTPSSTYDSVIGNASLTRSYYGMTAGLHYIQRIWFDSIGQHNYPVDSVIILPQPTPPTISLTSTPIMNSSGLIIISYNCSTNVTATVRKYISYGDSLHYLQSGSVKTVPAGSSGMLDTLGGALGSDCWIKVVITNPAASNTSYSPKIIAYVAPQLDWGVIDSIRTLTPTDTSNVIVYGRYNNYNQPSTIKIAFGLNDTVQIYVLGSLNTMPFSINVSNRVPNKQYYVVGLLVNSFGTRTLSPIPFKITYVPTPQLYITNQKATVSNLSCNITADYLIPSGSTNIDVDISTDTTSFTGSPQSFTKSGSGTISATFTNLSSGSYWARIQANYNNKPIIIYVPFLIPLMPITYSNVQQSISGGYVTFSCNYTIPTGIPADIHIQDAKDTSFTSLNKDTVLYGKTGSGNINISFKTSDHSPGSYYIRASALCGGQKWNSIVGQFTITAIPLIFSNMKVTVSPGIAYVSGGITIPVGNVTNITIGYTADSNSTQYFDSIVLLNKSGGVNIVNQFNNIPIGNYYMRISSVCNTVLNWIILPFTITKAMGINEVNDDPNKMMVSPNPCVDFLNVPYTGEYQIANIIGQVMMTGTIEDSQKPISLSELPNGNYFIIIVSGDGVKNAKFTKK